MEGFQMNEAARIHRAVLEFIGRQRVAYAQVLDGDVDLGDQQATFHRRPQARHQKGVIASSVGARHRAAGEPAQPIGDQPFAGD